MLLAEAFAEVKPDQELGVVIARKQRRLGIFHRKYLTSFITWMRDDGLYIDFSRVEWEVPKNKEDDLPQPRRGVV